MANGNLRNRLARLEAASLPHPIGVLREGQKFVKVDGLRMSLKEFRAAYPEGVLIRVTRREYKLVEEMT